jgi:branched-chain amino acid transport system permease protein
MKRLLSRTRRAAALRSLVVLVVLMVALIVVGPAIGAYQVTIVTTLLLYIAATTAWNLLGGVGGQFSLATSAFIGAGSYASVMMLRGDSTLPVWVTLVGAGAVAGIFAAATGLVLFRLRGFYFTIGTLAVALAALTWMTTWSFTGATTGISAPLADIPDTDTLYLMAIIVAGVALVASILVTNSPFGLRLMAVRDDEDVAASLGVSPFRTKMLTITLSGALTGVVGGLLAIQKVSIEPFSAFSLNWSITIVVMVIVGGIGSVWGPTVGAVLIYYGITVQLQNYPAISSILAGVLMVIVIVFVPNGIVGAARNLASALRRRGRHGQPSTPAKPHPVSDP